ncbi:MAG: hypothetical protein ACLP0J_28830 [Solirubrobacteraceae bacterium]
MPCVGHLDLRAAGEPRLELVVGCDGARWSNVERGHERALETVFGEVDVRWPGYRARGRENLLLYPADAQLNLPSEKHSHGMRRLAALGSGSERVAVWRSAGPCSPA